MIWRQLGSKLCHTSSNLAWPSRKMLVPLHGSAWRNCGKVHVGSYWFPWLLDFKCKVLWEQGRPSTAAQVHEGMMQAATFVHTNAYEALEAAAERFPGWPVMLTGHSMGGALHPS